MSYKKQMIHASFDLVKEFIPRIPQYRMPGENGTIARICVAPNIQSCLSAMPGSGVVLHNLLKTKTPFVIHAYYLQAEQVMETEQVKQFVPDADITGEMWILQNPEKIVRRDYIVIDPVLHQRDENEVSFISCQLKQTQYQDNWDLLAKRFQLKSGETFQTLKTNFLFSTLAGNMLPEIARLCDK